MLVPPSWRIAWRTARAVVHSGRRGAATAAATTPLAPLLLRDYQEECIQSVLASLKRGQKRLGISLATGSGKTVIFTQLVDRIPPSASGANRTLILAHRRELVEQAARHCTRTYPTKTIGIEMGSLHASGADDITIASVQSILSGERIHKFDPRQFKLVLVDEAHHIVARGYMQILEHFGLDRKVEIPAEKPLLPPSAADHRPALVGVSATFARFDGLALGAAIDEIVYHKDYVEMIGDGWLTDVIFTTVKSTVDLSQVRSDAGKDFRLNELSRAVNTPQANEVTVRTWLAKATVAGGAARPRNSTLVFCVDLSHVADLTAAFRKHGVEAYYITSETDKVERGQRLEAFKRGDFPVLLNCGVFTEGTDMPNVDCVLLARPTKSRNLLIQMIGRGMRLHAGKTNCHVIDMVSSLESGIVTTPTLFGLDPREIIDDASVEDLEALRDRKLEDESINIGSSSKPAPVNAPITKVRFTEYSSVLDLISDTSSERHIRGLSKNAWVQVAPERYVLCGPTGSYLRIEEVDESDQTDKDTCRFRVVELRALPRSVSKAPFAPPRQISRSETLTDAVHAADFYASKIFPHPFIVRHMPWRKNPASQGQLDFINKIRKEKDKPLTVDDITRGEAADMITKIKHGARGQFQTYQANRRRENREMAVRERERKRERVTVGPLPS